MKREESMLIKTVEWGVVALGILFLIEVSVDLWVLNENLSVRYALNHELLAKAESILKSEDISYAPGVYYESLVNKERQSAPFLAATRFKLKVSYPKGKDAALKRIVLSLDNPKLAAEKMPKAVTLYLCGPKNLSQAG